MPAIAHSDFEIRRAGRSPLWRRAFSAFQGGAARSRTSTGYDRNQFDSVGAFMARFSISPSPENYALVFRFCIGQDTALLPAVSELIKTGYAPDEARLASTCTKFETDLVELADNTQKQLISIEAVVSQSHTETAHYGEALQGAAEVIAGDSVDKNALAALFDLTRAMIVTTRQVESELRMRTKAIEGLQHSLTEAKQKADTDALTGLSNRRAFERKLGAAVERAKFSKSRCSLAICDIDLFKNINDRYGHQTGDQVIRLVADIVAEHCAEEGQVFRFGGEEFVVLFEGLDDEQALGRIEAARADLEGRNVIHRESGKALGTISLSAGFSTLGSIEDPGILLGCADRALYQAKAEGRNCIREAQH